VIFHHTGCAVRDLEASLRAYADLLGPRRRSRVFDVTSQKVRVCFLELAPGVHLELIEGVGERSPVERFTGTGFYHLCFLVDDLAAARDRLEQRFLAMPPFASEAFDGHRCQFLMNADRHWIELAEMAPEAFARFFEAQQADPQAG